MQDDDDDALVRQRILLEEIYEDLGPTATNFQGLSAEDLALLTSQHHGGKAAHVYGDTDGDLLVHLFAAMRPIAHDDEFCDLGSGNGRLLLQMALLTRVKSAVGIELSRTRHGQSTAALAEAARKGVLSPERARAISLYCDSMLGHAILHRSTLCFCYSLALEEAFMATLENDLAERLPSGALILLRGKPFPGVTTRAISSGETRAQRYLQPWVETSITNRIHQYYGYSVVDEREEHPPPTKRMLVLEQHTMPLGSTSPARFTRTVLAPPEPEEPNTLLQDLLEADGGIDALLGSECGYDYEGESKGQSLL